MANFVRQPIVTNGLVLCVDFANPKSYPGSGTILTDLSGSGNNGTLFNSPAFSSNNVGCLTFDGVDDYVSFGNPNSLKILTDQTLDFWVNPARRTIRQNFYEKAYGAEGTITYETDGNLNYYYGSAGGDGQPYTQIMSSGAPLASINTWYHVALVRDLTSASKTLKFYINGGLNASAAATISPIIASAKPVLLGKGYAGVFQGSIAIARIYNVALTAAQVAQNFSAQKTRFGL